MQFNAALLNESINSLKKILEVVLGNGLALFKD